jgi:hypothetical protein
MTTIDVTHRRLPIMRTPQSKMTCLRASAVGGLVAALAGTPAMAVDTSFAQEWTTGLPGYLLFGSIALLVLGVLLKLFGGPENVREESYPIPGSIGVHRNSVLDPFR